MSPTTVGLTCHISASPPPTGIIWEEDWATTAATTTAFSAAYGSKWQLEAETFNVGRSQMLQGAWNVHPDNTIVTAATSGGTGNSLKVQAVRGDHTEPCIPTGGTTVVPFSTGGINSRGNTGSGGDSGPYRLTANTITEVRMRFTSTRQGTRPIIWQTSYNRAEAEIDWCEYMGSDGNGQATGCTLSGLSESSHKYSHWRMFWSYGGTGTQSVGNNEDFNDTNWHVYQQEWLTGAKNSVKEFRDGQLIVHWGDPPWDARAKFAGFNPTTPFKWASAYQGTPNNRNNHTYPAPYDVGNISKLKLGTEVGGLWCQPIDPAALSSPAGTVTMGMEVDYVRVYDAAIHGAL